MGNKDIINRIRDTFDIEAPDRLRQLSFEAAKEYRDMKKPKITKKYVTAAAIYAAACVALIISIPFIIGNVKDLAPDPSNTETTVTEETPLHPEKDFGGAEFVILNSGIMYADGIDGADAVGNYIPSVKLMNAGVAERNEATERKYNVDIVSEVVADPATESYIRSQAGQNDFNLVLSEDYRLRDAALKGYYYNLAELDGLNLGESYWLPHTVDDLTVAGKLYLMGGKFTLDPLNNADFYYFNNTVVEDLSLISPYSYFEKNEWTLDNLLDLAIYVEADLNEDGEMNLYDDRFSGLDHDVVSRHLYYSIPLTEAKDGEYTLVPYTDELIQAYEKSNITNRLNGVAEIPSNYGGMDLGLYQRREVEVFCDDRALFLTQANAQYSDTIDGMGEYGIVPYPTLNAGDPYIAKVNMGSAMLAVPYIVRDPEMTGIVLDYMMSLSEELMYEKYIDLCAESADGENKEKRREMLNLITDSLAYEWTELYMYGSEINAIRAKMFTSGAFVSVTNRYAETIQQELTAVIDQIKNPVAGKTTSAESSVIFGYRDLFLHSSGNMTDVGEKDGYVAEYLTEIITPGEMYLMPELSLTLDADRSELLAVTFMGFSDGTLVDRETLRQTLVGGTEYPVPDFVKFDYLSYELVLFMTAEQFQEIKVPEGMQVIANLAEFPRDTGNRFNHIINMNSEDTAVAYIYLDIELDEEKTVLPADEWEAFKITVAEYYDTEIPEEYLNMLKDGTILNRLGSITGSYDINVEDVTILPELARIQVVVNKSQLTRLTEKHNVKFKVLH